MNTAAWHRRLLFALVAVLGIASGLAAKFLPLSAELLCLALLLVIAWFAFTGRIRLVRELSPEGRRNAFSALLVFLLAAVVVVLCCVLLPGEQLLGTLQQ